MRRGGSAVGLALIVAGVLVLFLTHSSLGAIIHKAGSKAGKGAISHRGDQFSAEPRSSAPCQPTWETCHRSGHQLPGRLAPAREHGSQKTDPMASTLKEPGSTTFNYIGVQNYVTEPRVAQATAATLDNGHYREDLSLT